MKKQKIGMVSAGCGEGKTYAVCKLIKDKRSFKNYLYVSKTINLLKQTADQLKEFDVESVQIHREYCSEPVKSIVDFLKSCDESNNVLLITWAAYQALPYFHCKENWVIYIDEIPDLDQFYKYKVPHNLSYLTDYISIDERINDTLARVVATDENDLRDFILNEAKQDQLCGAFVSLFRDVLNENKDVFVDVKSWNAICENKEIGRNDSENTVFFLTILNPRLFLGATLLGAHIEDSILYDWMTRFHETEFYPDKNIVSLLRPNNIDPNRLMVTYFIQGKTWSKGLRDHESDNRTVMDVIEKLLIKELNDDPFLLVGNNDYRGKLDSLKNCKRIPVDSKGMNDFQNYEKIVHVPALNREPKHSWMLNQLGFDNEVIRISTAYEVLYQNVMRTALRNQSSSSDVKIYVPTEFEADYLIEAFGEGVSKRMIGKLDFVKFMPLTQVQKNGNNKAKQSLNSNLKPLSLSPVFEYFHCKGIHDSNHFPTLNVEPPPQTGWILTFSENKYASKIDDFDFGNFDMHDLVKFFRQQSKNVVSTKDKVRLFNPIVYQPDEHGNYRLQKNFYFSTMAVLDFDDGEVSPEIFQRIFSGGVNSALKRSFIMMNSFSRSASRPNCFRVILPYKAPATSYDEHLAVYKSIVALLEAHGYLAEKSGLDASCINGVQPFYLPCTNRAHVDWHLFNAFCVGERDIERYAIEPKKYLKTMVSKNETRVVVPINRKAIIQAYSSDELEDKISIIMNDVRVLTSGRRTPFYSAGLKLLGLGLSIEDIRLHLDELAVDIGKENKGWVEGAIKSIIPKCRVAA